MTLVIITKVKLKQVNSTQLKWDPTGHPLWFNDLERDLYLIIGERELRHFELTIENNLLSGGASKALQFGKIKDDAGSRQDLSRLVEYQHEIPEDFKVKALALIQDCESIEEPLRLGLIAYINGFNFGVNPLQFKDLLKSYVPLEKRSSKRKSVPLRARFHSFKKSLPPHLGLKLVGVLCVFAVIFLFVNRGSSLGKEFLKMDSRINIPYINKYISKKGKLDVVDSLERSILHRSAPYIVSTDSHQYRAFEYLVLNKLLDPNQFDLNGRTPLYFSIKSYLNPDDIERSKAAQRAHLKVIENFLKLGLNSRLKKNPSDISAWELARVDNELTELLSKYR